MTTIERPNYVELSLGMPQIIRTDDHRYIYAGREYPGVTGILDVVDKSGALMHWAAKNTAEAALALMGTVVQVADDETINGLQHLVSTVGPTGAVKALTERSTWKRDEAAHLGTKVHGYADDLVNGRPIPELQGNQKAYVDQYARWWETAGWTIRTTEAIVLHESHGYGGTLDILARDEDKRTVLADIKTGKAIYNTAVLQLTAYGNAELIQTPAFDIYPMPAIDRYVILHVTADGVRPVEVKVGTFELNAWGACLDLSAWNKTTKGKRL
jgi:hypothetical protein